MGREELVVNIFATDPVKKIATQERVRQMVIPQLIQRGVSTEEALLALHFASTENISENALSEDRRFKGVVEELIEELDIKGMSEKAIRKMARQIAKGQHPTISITLPPASERGRYRLFGKVETKRSGIIATARDIWEPRMIEITSKFGQGVYRTPHHEVDCLMRDLGRSFDLLESRGNEPLEVSLRLAYFYIIGNRLIHPFVDANHRAFDRFLEYGFAKAGIQIDIPQDNTGNIPVTEMRFKTSTANLVTNLLRVNGLLSFNPNTPDEREIYQRTIVNVIGGAISSGPNDPHNSYNYLGAAGEFLKWTGFAQEDRIKALQEEAARRGGFRVMHI